MKDNLILYKKNGDIKEGIKGSVQNTNIYIIKPDFIIETEDILKRVMSNGGEELFLVKEPNFYEKHGGIPHNYQLKTKRINSMDDNKIDDEHKSISQTFNIGTINSHNTQIGNNNTMSVFTTEIDNKIIELIEEIKKQNFSREEEKEYLEIVEEVKQQLKKQEPKKRIIKSLLSSLPTLGSIGSIGSMIIGLL
jgi:hypothetical protein